MSITRSYNKITDTYYAYDTTYEWDERLQKKVQRKKCVGKFDPETGDVIPNGRRGRPAKQTTARKSGHDFSDSLEKREAGLAEVLSEAESLYARIGSIESMISRATKELDALRDSMGMLVKRLHAEKRGGQS